MHSNICYWDSNTLQTPLGNLNNKKKHHCTNFILNLLKIRLRVCWDWNFQLKYLAKHLHKPSVCKSLTLFIWSSHLLPFSVQTEQADKATDLQKEINKNSQASKHGERPDCWHAGQRSWKRKRKELFYQYVTHQGTLTHFVAMATIRTKKKKKKKIVPAFNAFDKCNGNKHY